MSSNVRTLLREHGFLASLVCASLALGALVRGLDFALLFAVGPAVAILTIAALVRAVAKPAARARLGVLALVAVLTAGAVYGIVQYRIYSDAVAAQLLATAVINYKGRFGVFPETLIEADVKLSGAAARLGAKYIVHAGDPLLEYSDAWNFFKKHKFDFRTQQWNPIWVQ